MNKCKKEGCMCPKHENWDKKETEILKQILYRYEKARGNGNGK